MLELALIFAICIVVYYKFIKKNPEDDFMKELMLKQAQFQDQIQVEEEVKIVNSDVIILYSTQTGNALYYSKKLQDIILTYAMSAIVVNVGKIDLRIKLPCKLIIFVVSTFGDGDPSDDAITFYKELKQSDDNIFSDMDSVILGLGSSTYPRFNQAARHLKKLIGKPLLYKELDETKSLEMEFYNFISEFEPFLIEYGSKFGLKMSKTDKNIDVIYNSTKENILLGLPIHELVVDRTYPKLLRIANIDKIFEKDRICWHLEFELNDKEPKLNWEYGDHVAIYPQNSLENVLEMVNYFSLDEKTEEQELKVINGPTIVDSNFLFNEDVIIGRTKLDTVVLWEKEPARTIRTLLRFYIDLSAPVPINLIQKFKSLGYAQIVNDEFYKMYVFDKKLSIMDFVKLLQIPPTEKVLECILLYMTRIAARWYSITSSERLGDSISVCAITVDYNMEQPSMIKNGLVSETKSKKMKGLCTSYFTRCEKYLQRYHKSDGQISPLIVPVFTRKSNFKIPKYPVPMLWVGPGINY
eukprot:NODE_2_length_91304_cov_0.692462.p12 type:complete len:525 gc:universal NODE_2_length_91304_cov_0.692462:4063-2489(-)